MPFGLLDLCRRLLGIPTYQPEPLPDVKTQIPPEVFGLICTMVSNADLLVLCLLSRQAQIEAERLLYRTVEFKWFGTRHRPKPKFRKKPWTFQTLTLWSMAIVRSERRAGLVNSITIRAWLDFDSAHVDRIRKELSHAFAVVHNLKRLQCRHGLGLPPMQSLLQPWMFEGVKFRLRVLAGDVLFHDQKSMEMLEPDWDSIWKCLDIQNEIEELTLGEHALMLPSTSRTGHVLPNLRILHLSSTATAKYFADHPIKRISWFESPFNAEIPSSIITSLSAYPLTHLCIKNDVFRLSCAGIEPSPLSAISVSLPYLRFLQYTFMHYIPPTQQPFAEILTLGMSGCNVLCILIIDGPVWMDIDELLAGRMRAHAPCLSWVQFQRAGLAFKHDLHSDVFLETSDLLPLDAWKYHDT